MELKDEWKECGRERHGNDKVKTSEGEDTLLVLLLLLPLLLLLLFLEIGQTKITLWLGLSSVVWCVCVLFLSECSTNYAAVGKRGGGKKKNTRPTHRLNTHWRFTMGSLFAT